jgi:hypothetical protein
MAACVAVHFSDLANQRSSRFENHSFALTAKFVMLLSAVMFFFGSPAPAAVLDKQPLLEAQNFWDNRDWDWYKSNIPFFTCPDKEITTTYYYRWELLTKHLTYGSQASGYSFTEFIDRPFWSGAYGAISCPAGHQLYEARWLRDKRYAQDYARYWFRTPGAQPRRYSTWLADAIWAVSMAEGDEAFAKDLLPDLIKNFQGWEQKYFVPEIGLFWQIGHDDGMEYNINSRQTRDLVRGGPGFRPSFNAYMWADMQAIAHIAEQAGDTALAQEYRRKAESLKNQMQSRLWDSNRNFFFNMFKEDEPDQDGNVVKALTLTYQSGKFAGSPHGREDIGFVPWQFNMPAPGFESAWQFLMKPNYFFAAFGPTTVERNDPLFVLQARCCWWSGMSWPYATTQTLKALANLLQNYQQQFITRADYFKLLRIYALTQRKEGRPYIAEAAHPDTGSYSGHDSYNHSEHYFHSGFNDLILTGLVGLKPRQDEIVEVDPLAPPDWDWFAVDDVPYHGHLLAILWDRDGDHFHRGSGFQILADGKKIAASQGLGRLAAKLPHAPSTTKSRSRVVNFAVNNDTNTFPRLAASYTNSLTPLAKINDGNYWYHQRPPNRWTTEGSTNSAEWVLIDFGEARKISSVKLFVLDDGGPIAPPSQIALEYWNGKKWTEVPRQKRSPAKPTGHRANTIAFPELPVNQLRVLLTPGNGRPMGLSELEVWGDEPGV